MMSANVFNILDFSDEILINIMCHLSARERALLGSTCTKFYRLAFGEKRFVRNLDFSEDGYLTSSTDVQQYFKDVTMCQHMRTINLGSMCCSSPRPMLRDLKKAVNLVELNIIGIKFANYSDLGSLLDPLENLRKLSAGWPEHSVGLHGATTMRKSFNRLKHLTMRLNDFNFVMSFVPVLLNYSSELEELFILLVEIEVSSFDVDYLNEVLEGLQLTELPKLKIAAGYNMNYHHLLLSHFFVQILPDFERWTLFHMNRHGLLYYEKDAMVTPEMCSHIRPEVWPDDRYESLRNLAPGHLLAHAAQVATGREAKNFDCLRQDEGSSHPVMLKIKDIKLLLQNPGHQISYIHVEHDLEPTCLAYLSAFPYLRHLVLYGVIKAFPIPYNPAEIDGNLKNVKKRNEAANPNPVFRKLVENTPHLKDFALSTEYNDEDDPWDLPALHLIASWKELTTLFLSKIPIVNGKFLVEIGKQCENLEKLRLEDIGPYSKFCYKNELSQMLIHCRNLKDFSIAQNNIGRVSDVLTMFSKNHKLQRLRIKSCGQSNTLDNVALSIEKLIRSHELILLWFEFEILSVATRDNLRSIVQRLKDELDRRAFEFVIMNDWELHEFGCHVRKPGLEYAHNDLLHEHTLTNALYQLGC